jgi:hypothetical protein
MKRVHNFDLVTSCWIFSNRIFRVFVEHKNCLVSTEILEGMGFFGCVY